MKKIGIFIETKATTVKQAVFGAITGSAPVRRGGAAEIVVEDALIRIHPGPARAGLVAVLLEGLPSRASDPPLIHNGLRIEAIASRSVAERSEARLDHVAVLVKDLDGASAEWSALTGVVAEQLGPHPISDGAFLAARLLLGERMIELLQPVEGIDSPLAQRLASHGEGAATLALPVADLTTARDRLEAIDARVLFRDPHWMVHPGDTGGVLVQLTPRVAH